MFNPITEKTFLWNKVSKICLAALLLPCFLTAQNINDTTLQRATLDNCVRYALQQNTDLKNAHLMKK